MYYAIRRLINTKFYGNGEVLFVDREAKSVSDAILNMLSIWGVTENKQLNRYNIHPELIEFFEKSIGEVNINEDGTVYITGSVNVTLNTDPSDGLRGRFDNFVEFNYVNGKITILEFNREYSY